MKSKNAYGFTLVELLIVIVIISMLMALLLPAVGGARESMRQAACKNNIYQLSRASINHESKHGHFPSGGWGYGWVGDVNAGVGEKQPGGWIYNSLPELQQEPLYMLGYALTSSGSEKSESTMKSERETALKTPLPFLYCPSRRDAVVYPCTISGGFFNTNTPSAVGKTDYCYNGGDGKDIAAFGKGDGFNNLTETAWRQQTFGMEYPGCDRTKSTIANGLSQRRTGIRPEWVTDGGSYTYLLGEKYLNPDTYTTGTAGHDDQGWSIGFDQDIVRFSKHNTEDKAIPFRDRSGYSTPEFAFGSAHPDHFMMSMCDGSVRGILYSIDPEVHAHLGIRNDGVAHGADEF
ncbi:MAG: DUF1559 domain-containing protein [Planctomycetia bacterium]|nr:DUF1559 domain-containing protein [Planctomycetia bacterium]